MLLDFNGEKVRARIAKRDTITSRHTGCTLRRLTLEIIITGRSDSDRFLGLVQQARETGVESISNDGDVDARWKIETSSWHYTEGHPVFYHTLDIEEDEQLEIDELIVGDLHLRPYEYDEEFDNDCLIITGKVLIDQSDYDSLLATLKESRYVPVIRKGINDTPVEMRTGLCYWSEHSEGIKRQLLFVDKAYDDLPHSGSLFSWMDNAAVKAAENAAKLESLLALLTEKGYLTKQEIESINQDTEDRMKAVSRSFFKVDDIDTEK